MKSLPIRWTTTVSMILVACGVLGAKAVAQSQPFFIAGYGPGVFVSQLSVDGKMSEPKLIVKQKNPSFFAFHPKLEVVYVVSETMRSDSSQPGIVAAYRFDRAAYIAGKTPDLRELNSQPVNGDIPCHVSVDATGNVLVVANYTSGSVAAYPLASDGSILSEACLIQHKGSGPNKGRQEGPHAHCSLFDPTNRYVFVADLGIDKVLGYEFDQVTAVLKPVESLTLKLPPGSGPRHLAFHPNKKFLFVINELGMTMSTAAYDSAKPSLTLIDTVSTLPEGTKGDHLSTAEVIVHPSGEFVYGSNRGHNTIVAFRIDQASGKLNRIDNYDTKGKTPRNFRIDPKGDWLLAENQESDSIYSFRIDPATGKLTPSGHSANVPGPACIRFLAE